MVQFYFWTSATISTEVKSFQDFVNHKISCFVTDFRLKSLSQKKSMFGGCCYHGNKNILHQRYLPCETW